MDSIPLGLLILALIICLAFSAFFSASETAMMSLNRYKLKHLADEGNKRAKCASHLLKHTDRLIGTILLGNNFVNIAATSLGTLIGLRLYGDLGVLLSTIILTVVVLVFSGRDQRTTHRPARRAGACLAGAHPLAAGAPLKRHCPPHPAPAGHQNR